MSKVLIVKLGNQGRRFIRLPKPSKSGRGVSVGFSLDDESLVCSFIPVDHIGGEAIACLLKLHDLWKVYATLAHLSFHFQEVYDVTDQELENTFRHWEKIWAKLPDRTSVDLKGIQEFQ